MTLQSVSPRNMIILVFLVTLVVYGNTFLNQWTYDDVPVVVQNPDAHSIAGFLENSRPGRPLRELTYIPEYMLFGNNPSGYHIQQLGWHAANGILVYLLLTMAGLSGGYSLLGALLFVVHPLQVESVANISHRKELLALFFSLLSFLAYGNGVAAKGNKRILLVVAAFLAYGVALSANQTAVPLPVACLLFEYLYVPPEERLLLKRPRLLGGVLLVAGAFVLYRYRGLFATSELLTIYSKNSFGASTSYLPLFMADLKAYGFYLYKIVVPLSLAPEYVFRFSESLVQWGAFAGLALLVGTVAAGYLARKTAPAATFGIGWFLLLYLPVSNIVPVAYVVADRYMYLCLPGVALFVAFLLQKMDSRAVNIGFCAVLLVLSGLTVVQNTYWRNEHTLWRHAVEVNPDSTWVRETVALSYLLTGEFDKARDNARKAIELDRLNSRAYLTLAKAEDRLGNLDEAIRNYELFLSFGFMEYPAEAANVKVYMPFLLKRAQSIRQDKGK